MAIRCDAQATLHEALQAKEDKLAFMVPWLNPDTGDYEMVAAKFAAGPFLID